MTDRLGLWVLGTPFPNGFGGLQMQIAPGGVAATGVQCQQPSNGARD